MSAKLRRYWVRFNERGWILGCGVTAWTGEDALALLAEGPFRERSLPEIIEVTCDVDVSMLDAGHVLPNMEAPDRRGVWYPRGFLLR